MRLAKFEVIDHRRRRLLGTATVSLAVAGLGLTMSSNVEALAAPKAPSFAGATGWLNTAPLAAADLRGKVVLIDFWTFDCVNCRNALPYVRAWAEKYKDQGLVVIGVHTPEFTFEQDVDNVRRAAAAMNVTYPIALDSRYDVWNAFANRYWPALYFIDANGRIRDQQFGEGEYEQSERVIQDLLAEAGQAGVDRSLVSVAPRGAEVAADWSSLKSPENYIGYAKSEGFASFGGFREDVPSRYRTASTLPRNGWGLTGVWTAGREFAAPSEASGRITYRFHARDVNLVLAPPAQGRAIRFRVKLDGAAPGAHHGVDVDADGFGTVHDGRLYQLIRQTGAIADRTFEIEFHDPDVRAYAFTFG